MQMAINAKTKSILVLSGETDEEMYKKQFKSRLYSYN